MFYFYILRCSDNTLYCGQTNNLENRIKEHNFDKSKSAKYTKVRRPVKLIYSEEYQTLQEAMKRESQIKTWTKAKKEALINNDFLIRIATLDDLDSILSLSDELTLSDLPYDKEVDINWAHTDKGKEYYREKIVGKNGICFVAEKGNKIVGYATAAQKEVPSYRLVKVAELENLVVIKTMRSKGIGKKLLNRFLKWAKEIGANKAAVDVFSLNEKGVAFYKREGFLPFETILEMSLKGNSNKI